MRRDELPSVCFTARGKIKVRNTLRHLYDTLDLIPADNTLLNLWSIAGDSVTPKQISRARSSLAGPSGDGYVLEKTPGGKWRVAKRPNGRDNGFGVTDLFYDSADNDAMTTGTYVATCDPDGDVVAPGWFKPYAVMIERIYSDLTG